MAKAYKTVPLSDMMDTLTPERRAHVEARAADLIAEERTLRDVRKAMGLTQVTWPRR